MHLTISHFQGLKVLLGVKHLIAQFGLTSRPHAWVRTDLSNYLKVAEMHTQSSDWKHVIVIM
jgi:hypothetical protein